MLERQTKKWLEALNTVPFVIARSCKESLDEVWVSVVVNSRRSNLPSLVNYKELFKHFRKNTLTQTQSREIASGMQQRLTGLIANTFHTEPRNDESVGDGVCYL